MVAARSASLECGMEISPPTAQKHTQGDEYQFLVIDQNYRVANQIRYCYFYTPMTEHNFIKRLWKITGLSFPNMLIDQVIMAITG